MFMKYGLAANIVKEHIDENGILRHGTKELLEMQRFICMVNIGI